METDFNTKYQDYQTHHAALEAMSMDEREQLIESGRARSNYEFGFEVIALSAAVKNGLEVQVADGKAVYKRSDGETLTIVEDGPRGEGEPYSFIVNPSGPEDGYGERGRQNFELLDARVGTFAAMGAPND